LRNISRAVIGVENNSDDLQFCLLISSDVGSTHFVTFLLLHVKRLQFKLYLF